MLLSLVSTKANKKGQIIVPFELGLQYSNVHFEWYGQLETCAEFVNSDSMARITRLKAVILLSKIGSLHFKYQIILSILICTICEQNYFGPLTSILTMDFEFARVYFSLPSIPPSCFINGNRLSCPLCTTIRV